MSPFLAADDVIDFDHPSIQAFIASRGWRNLDSIARTKAAYEFVRDEIPHAFDVGSDVCPCRASDVLRERVGICYAKSHLLVALLRAMEIPAGLVYQRLTLFEDPKDGFVVHALVAARLEERWVRMDARGNKPGVNAQFSLAEERLAFAIRPEMGEVDSLIVHAKPTASTVTALNQGTCLPAELMAVLPSELEEETVDNWKEVR